MSDIIDSQHSNASDSSIVISPYPSFGFDVDEIENINARFKCIFCFRIIREAIQLLECGHRSCRGCFESRATVAPDENVMCQMEDCKQITNKNAIMLDKAFNRELDNLKIACVHRKSSRCNWEGILKYYQSHLDEVHIRYICSECNECLSSEATLDEHIRRLCPRIFQPCPLRPFCTEDMIRQADFLNHFQSEKHQQTVNKFLLGEYQLPDSSTHEQHIAINTMNRELEKKMSELLINTSKSLQTVSDESIHLNNDFKISNERFNALVQEINNLRLSILERLPIKQSIQRNQESHQKDIENLHESIKMNEHIFNDGTLVWRINHVSEKLADAQSERQTSITSPIFFSSPTGYKMRAKLFLFGDGNARRTHVSLFFSLLKGDHDALLKWPFSYKITFCLLDQTGNNRHIIDSFFPDVKSTSFQRPKDEANIASGIPKFFQLSLLLQDDNVYVREDTMYIKIIVSFHEAPKSLLPYILTLNPALPTHVKENLISQEAAKRQQQITTTDSTQATSMNI